MDDLESMVDGIRRQEDAQRRQVAQQQAEALMRLESFVSLMAKHDVQPEKLHAVEKRRARDTGLRGWVIAIGTSGGDRGPETRYGRLLLTDLTGIDAKFSDDFQDCWLPPGKIFVHLMGHSVRSRVALRSPHPAHFSTDELARAAQRLIDGIPLFH